MEARALPPRAWARCTSSPPRRMSSLGALSASAEAGASRGLSINPDSALAYMAARLLGKRAACGCRYGPDSLGLLLLREAQHHSACLLAAFFHQCLAVKQRFQLGRLQSFSLQQHTGEGLKLGLPVLVSFLVIPLAVLHMLT